MQSISSARFITPNVRGTAREVQELSEGEVIRIFIDGACEPVNPGGIATYGFVVYQGGKKVAEGSGVVEHPDPSNNIAEYSAAIAALRWLLESGLRGDRIVLTSDSNLLVSQLAGAYGVRAQRVLPLYEELERLIDELRRQGKKVVCNWVPREENTEADALSKRAYEEFCASHPEALQHYAEYLVSEKQRKFMEKLGIPIPPGLSKRAASKLIDERLEELRSEQR